MKNHSDFISIILIVSLTFTLYYYHNDNKDIKDVFEKQAVAGDEHKYPQRHTETNLTYVQRYKNKFTEEQIINVKNFGATGDGLTNDTNSIQRAIDSAKEGQIVYFPGAKYRFDSLDLKSGITYDFGNSELICNSDTPLTAKGSIKAVTTIGNYKAFNKTVSLGSVAKIEKNDILHLIALEDPFNTFRKEYCKGGTTSIFAINEHNSSVEIAEPFLFDIKSPKTTAKVVKPWRGKICNIKSAFFEQKNTLKYFIQIEYGYMAKIENVNCSMDDGLNIINFKYCCLCSIENCNLYKTKVHSLGYSYNIFFCACTRCTIKNCNMKTMWHCYTNGGGDGCTVGTIIDNCCILTDGKVPAFTEHSNGINTSIFNSVVEGFVMSCGALIKKCLLLEPHNFPRTGSTCFQLKGQHQNWSFNNYTLEDCIIKRTRDSADCIFVIKNEDTTRNKSNKNKVYINNINMIRCFASDQDVCKLSGFKRTNAEVNQISIENCRNIIAEFTETKMDYDLGNRIKKVSLKDNFYKDKIAFFTSGYVNNILIENCIIDNATKNTSVLNIESADSVILRNIKGCGLPVFLTISIGSQNQKIKDLLIENIDAKEDSNTTSLKVQFSLKSIIETAYITSCAVDNFTNLNIIKHLFGNDCTYKNQLVDINNYANGYK